MDELIRIADALNPHIPLHALESSELQADPLLHVDYDMANSPTIDMNNADDDFDMAGSGDPVNNFEIHDAGSGFIDTHPNAAKVYRTDGRTFMDNFDQDTHTEKRIDNVYYPFASRSEWELASFLLGSNLSMTAIDKFLSLDLVSHRTK
jgi:hypothetical protein